MYIYIVRGRGIPCGRALSVYKQWAHFKTKETKLITNKKIDVCTIYFRPRRIELQTKN